MSETEVSEKTQMARTKPVIKRTTGKKDNSRQCGTFDDKTTAVAGALSTGERSSKRIKTTVSAVDSALPQQNQVVTKKIDHNTISARLKNGSYALVSHSTGKSKTWDNFRLVHEVIDGTVSKTSMGYACCIKCNEKGIIDGIYKVS